MLIRGPGQPGPRLTPVDVSETASEGEPSDRPPKGAEIHDHGARFAMIACHSSRDGFAAITLQDLATGALVRVQKVPFEHHDDEDFESQCTRIQAAARQIVQNVADAMAAAVQSTAN
jgi:hypothetical protein